MKYQRKLHDAFGEKVVPVRVRRVAFDVVGEADAEIELLRSKAESLQDVLRRISRIGHEDGLTKDEYQQRLAAAVGRATDALKHRL